MDFECSNMSIFGCERMDYVKELMLADREELICINMCCIGCLENCGYRCNKSKGTKEGRLAPNISEELETEKLLGIRCYNCGKEINREGHKLNILSDEVEEIWFCDDCFKSLIGSKKEDD